MHQSTVWNRVNLGEAVCPSDERTIRHTHYQEATPHLCSMTRVSKARLTCPVKNAHLTSSPLAYLPKQSVGAIWELKDYILWGRKALLDGGLSHKVLWGNSPIVSRTSSALRHDGREPCLVRKSCRRGQCSKVLQVTTMRAYRKLKWYKPILKYSVSVWLNQHCYGRSISNLPRKPLYSTLEHARLVDTIRIQRDRYAN